MELGSVVVGMWIITSHRCHELQLPGGGRDIRVVA